MSNSAFKQSTSPTFDRKVYRAIPEGADPNSLPYPRSAYRIPEPNDALRRAMYVRVAKYFAQRYTIRQVSEMVDVDVSKDYLRLIKNQAWMRDWIKAAKLEIINTQSEFPSVKDASVMAREAAYKQAIRVFHDPNNCGWDPGQVAKLVDTIMKNQDKAGSSEAATPGTDEAFSKEELHQLNKMARNDGRMEDAV